MTWSYDDSLTEAKDRIRVLLGDTDETDQLISDEAIAVYLTGGALAQASELLSAAAVAGVVAAKLARRAVSISEGGTSVNWGDQAKRYRDLADALIAQDLAGDGSAAFDIAEMNLSPFGARELLSNAALRGSP